jgi:hypothetical protein
MPMLASAAGALATPRSVGFGASSARRGDIFLKVSILLLGSHARDELVELLHHGLVRDVLGGPLRDLVVLHALTEPRHGARVGAGPWRRALIGWITVIFIGTFIQNWKNVRLGSGIHCPMGGLESQISAGESNI